MEKEEFLKLLPKLIREDDEVKGAIISALSGVVATKNDIERIIENSNKRFEQLIQEITQRFEKADQRFEEMIQQINQRFERVDQRFEQASKERAEISKKVDELTVAVGALGGRSGINLENTIINLLNEKLIKENIPISKIHKKDLVDKKGEVFTKGYSTDVDIVIEDGKVILIEIKYNPDNRDIYHFLNIAKLYKSKYQPYDQLILLGLEMKQQHINYAEEQGIKVIVGKVIL
jgi:hypothetical protein